MDTIDFSRPAPILQRLILAWRFDRKLYTAAALDPASRGAAWMVVLLAETINGVSITQGSGAPIIAIAALIGCLRWTIWALVVYAVGWGLRYRLAGRSLSRPLGFAHAPALFFPLAMMPEIAAVVHVVIPIWLLATTTAAVQAAYDTTQLRAVVIAGVAFLVYLVFGGLSAILLA